MRTMENRHWRLTLCSALMAAFVGLAAGTAVADDEGGKIKLMDRDHLFGDWGGARTTLENHGLAYDLTYTSEYLHNVDGGIDEGGKYRADLSLTIELDTEAAGLWENGQFFAHLQYQHGDSITEDYVGDFQVLSNIDADDFFQLSEIWYKHTFLDGALWLKVGKQETNEDFAFVEHGGEFLNSSGGFLPSIPLVTFPDPGLGLAIGIEPVDWFSMNVGAYESRADGGRSLFSAFDELYGPTFMIEPVFHYSISDREGHLRLGYWYVNDNFDTFAGGTQDGTRGFYVTCDQTLYCENPDDDSDEQGLGMFLQYGHSDDDVMEVEHYFGGGLQWIGAIPSRDDDILGIGTFTVEFSDQAGFVEGNETFVELFYKAQVTPWFSVKPDIQFVSNPGGTANDNALVIGLRTEVSF